MAPDRATRVAVIGAGISGVVSAAHLLSRDVEVTLFERNSSAGGVWYVDFNTLPLILLIGIS
jgi:cation diffusion facilitator CzcD-associated flavoprotein CzcO